MTAAAQTANATPKWPSWLFRAAAVIGIVITLNHGTRQEEATSASIITGNGGAPKRVVVSSADAGSTGQVARTLLNIRRPLTYGQYLWDDAGVPPGDIWIRIDLSTQILSVFRGGHEVGTSVIMYGGDDKPTPTGQLSVLWKKEDHRSRLYDAKMPYTLRLTGDGISIHGADVKARTATNGCISVPPEFARLLFAQTTVGTPVTILRDERTSQNRTPV